jgi:HEAT repeat protein
MAPMTLSRMILFRLFAAAWASFPLAAATAAEAPADAPAPSAERIGALVRQLGSTDGYDVREAARQELLAIGVPAEPALVEALGNDAPRVRRAACELLGRMTSAAAVPRLVDRLRDADPALQEAAADALERIGATALEAVAKARDAGALPSAVADAVLERPVRRAVESRLDRCISKDLGWGFYKDQFKDIVALGPAATRILLRLFTTPETDYVFLHTFDSEPNEVRVRYRKQVIQRLAGEALVDMKDPSVVPALKAFLDSLGEVNPLDERDPRQEFQEATAFALMRLGETSAYQKMKDFFLKASEAKVGPDGALTVALAADLKRRQDQFTALTRLAMLQIRADDLPEAERTYRTIIDLALAKQGEAGLKVFDADRDGKLDAKERRAMDEAVESILRRAYAGPVTADLEKFWREYVFCRGILRGAYYNLACTYGQMAGKKAEALDALKKAVRCGYDDAEWIKRDRDLESIKEEPEYKRMIHDLERKKQREEERGQ